MTAETVAWLWRMDWQTILMVCHVVGIVLVVCAATAGYAAGASILFVGGQQPGRMLVGFVHNSIAFGLVLVWCSGGGLLMIKNMLGPHAIWPDALTFKLIIVATFSLSVWLVRVLVLPMARVRQQPLAADLGWGALVGIAFVASVSMSCWIILVAMALSTEVQALPIERLYGFLAGLVALFMGACLLLAAGIRLLTPRRQPQTPVRTANRRRRQRDGRPGSDATSKKVPRQRSNPQPNGASLQEPVLTGLTEHAVKAMQARPVPLPINAPQVRRASPHSVAPHPVTQQQPVSSLSNRLCQLHYEDPARQLRDKVAREWSRNTRPPESRPRWTPTAAAAAKAAAAAAARESEADDWLLQKWLRRPR
ncbi:MAG: hypothetical protein ACR2PI_04070 [Hyphomicrobiaceae bacterium]